MLRLETEAGSSKGDPSREDVVAALQSLDGDGNNFAILLRGDSDFVQARGSAAQGFGVEYHDPISDEHFVSAAMLNLQQTLAIFEDYHGFGQRWKTMTTWKAHELKGKRGCGSQAVLLLAGASVVIGAAITGA
jgi:hypothetical protein